VSEAAAVLATALMLAVAQLVRDYLDRRAHRRGERCTRAGDAAAGVAERRRAIGEGYRLGTGARAPRRHDDDQEDATK
jgi:hypothetical protein